MSVGVRIALVTNLATHYRRPLFEEISRRIDIDFFFTSQGSESYWLAEHTMSTQGLSVRGRRRRDLLRLVSSDYAAIVATLTGRVALPIAFASARLRRRPFLVWVGIWEHPETLFHKLSRPVTRMIYRRADAVLVYGTHVARYVESESGRTENLVVVPQAVDNERFRREPMPHDVGAIRGRLPGVEHIALYVGRVEEEKGLDHLIAAVASNASWGLIVVGTGTLLEELRRLASHTGIGERVRFSGYVAQEDLLAYLHAADVLVLPSVSTKRFREPWGLVVNEAMNSGLPVVVTDAVGAAAGGLVRDSVTGLIVPERDAVALGQALAKLEDVNLRSALGTAGREHVAAWSYDAAADAIVGAVKKAVAG